MEGGILRRKRRASRRPGFPRALPGLFELGFALETAGKAWRAVRCYWRRPRSSAEVIADPDRLAYTDLAILPATDDDVETLDLFHETAGGEAFVAKKAKQDAIIDAVHAAHQPA
jgi:hypothetical protein